MADVGGPELSLGGADAGDFFVERMLRRALQLKASDIHLESPAGSGRIRMRLDGILHEEPQLGRDFARQSRAVISRLKILADLDIAEHRLPQDGSFRWTGSTGNAERRKVDARLSLVPAQGGERAVIRLVEQGGELLRLDDLGMEEGQGQDFAAALSGTQGLVLVIGPTGSGKTTTLYAALEELSRPQRCILSVEDPVERTLAGVGQVQVNPGIGLDFQRMLRAFLRQDPQVLMVGEIRDAETAVIAVRASLTGHLVLSTLHARNSLAAIIRLRDMGLENWLLSASLSLIVAQRLVRRLCVHCRRPDAQSLPLLRSAGIRLSRAPMAAVGCDQCGDRGYSGRKALFEVLPVSAQLSACILAGADEVQLQAAAEDFRDLRQCAADALEVGDLSAEEFFRVLG